MGMPLKEFTTWPIESQQAVANTLFRNRCTATCIDNRFWIPQSLVDYLESTGQQINFNTRLYRVGDEPKEWPHLRMICPNGKVCQTRPEMMKHSPEMTSKAYCADEEAGAAPDKRKSVVIRPQARKFHRVLIRRREIGCIDLQPVDALGRDIHASAFRAWMFNYDVAQPIVQDEALMSMIAPLEMLWIQIRAKPTETSLKSIKQASERTGRAYHVKELWHIDADPKIMWMACARAPDEDAVLFAKNIPSF